MGRLRTLVLLSSMDSTCFSVALIDHMSLIKDEDKSNYRPPASPLEIQSIICPKRVVLLLLRLII